MKIGHALERFYRIGIILHIYYFQWGFLKGYSYWAFKQQMHDQKWGEGSDKPFIPMTKHRIKTNTMDYMSWANHILKNISGAIDTAVNKNTIGDIVKT
jgi:hypothetical protein